MGAGGSSSGGWGAGGSSSGPWTSQEYGFREFVNLLEKLLSEYGRHALIIRPLLPPAVAGAMDILVGIADLKTWNEPGPE